ncbi:protein kinase domain-containing protein [Pyxidicoccus sp. MSG2]|uniref:protein kinase domain-containing protein n=1 Tax=Pyxidicoccus sp. MSG2 TaxID=2996790 RepID=UPI00226E28BA|nr:protein kinase [Pyxidicoccus sp. MSG2]MCY1023757.1 protein kinase [Pyxidicoccus sp. MSG2]
MNPLPSPPLPSCPDENLLAAFATGSLPGAKVPGVEAHLDGCADCRALVAAVASESSHPGTSDSDVPTRLDTGAPTLSDARPEMALPPGTRLGSYLIRGVLGMGGMGVVYAADDPRLGRRVALKLLRPLQEGAEQEGRARLLLEAQAMARLSHPNVLPIFELGTAEGRDFLAMEWVEGTTLGDWLRARERPWREVVEVFLAAGAGLAAAHRAGLVHRDFKPSNVLVGLDGRVRVTDFGLARHGTGEQDAVTSGVMDEASPSESSALTQRGRVPGTPAYMSPEQRAGRAVDARSDQYSFCVALHEALQGERPPGLPASSSHRALPRRARARDLPKHVLAALARGLAKAPEERFPSMDALMAVLSHSPPSRLLRMGGLTVVLAGVGIGLFLWKQPQRHEPPDARVQAAPVAAERGDTANTLISLREDQVKDLPVPKLQRIAVGDPAIVEVEILDGDVLRLTGRSAGTTNLVTWTRENGEMQLYTLSVTAR